MLDGVVCIDCRRPAPPASANDTLLRHHHGWRLWREHRADGSVQLEWRCGRCWNEYKARTGATSSTAIASLAGEAPAAAPDSGAEGSRRR